MARTPNLIPTAFAVLVVTAAAAGVWLALGDDADAAASPDTTAASADAGVRTAGEPTGAPAPVDVDLEDDEESSESGILMPDGTRVPALNGVVEAPPLKWNHRVPWSPIIGKQTIEGLEWYVHADGSKSTTKLGWRRDLGRMDAMAIVQHPVDPKPSIDNR